VKTTTTRSPWTRVNNNRCAPCFENRQKAGFTTGKTSRRGKTDADAGGSRSHVSLRGCPRAPADMATCMRRGEAERPGSIAEQTVDPQGRRADGWWESAVRPDDVHGRHGVAERAVASGTRSATDRPVWTRITNQPFLGLSRRVKWDRRDRSLATPYPGPAGKRVHGDECTRPANRAATAARPRRPSTCWTRRRHGRARLLHAGGRGVRSTSRITRRTRGTDW